MRSRGTARSLDRALEINSNSSCDGQESFLHPIRQLRPLLHGRRRPLSLPLAGLGCTSVRGFVPVPMWEEAGTKFVCRNFYHASSENLKEFTVYLNSLIK